MLTIEICRQVLHHPVYFCDGATTPLLGYDFVSAASLVIDTEARQVWSKRTVQCGYAEQFTPPTTESLTATDPATVRRSFTAASTTVNSTATDPSTVYITSTTSTTPSSAATNPPSVRRSSTTITSTIADPSTTTSAAGQSTAALSASTASTTRDTLLRRWRPFVCCRASPRGPVTTASLLLLHRLLPTSVTLHVRQQPSLQPPTPPTSPTSTHLLHSLLQCLLILLPPLLLIHPCPLSYQLTPLPPRIQIRMLLTEMCQGVTSSRVDDRRSSSWTARPS